jgi:hypothetical protein
LIIGKSKYAHRRHETCRRPVGPLALGWRQRSDQADHAGVKYQLSQRDVANVGHPVAGIFHWRGLRRPKHRKIHLNMEPPCTFLLVLPPCHPVGVNVSSFQTSRRHSSACMNARALSAARLQERIDGKIRQSGPRNYRISQIHADSGKYKGQSGKRNVKIQDSTLNDLNC